MIIVSGPLVFFGFEKPLITFFAVYTQKTSLKKGGK